MKLTWWEKGPGYAEGLRDLFSTFNISTIGTGFVAAVFAYSVDVVMVEAAKAAGWDMAQIVPWIFAQHVISSIMGLSIFLYYKQPIVTANSITGGVLFASAAVFYSMNELVGASIFAGLLVFLLGITGSMEWVMKRLPLPVVLGMTGGVLLRFITGIPGTIVNVPKVAIATLAGFLIFSIFFKRLPATLGALLFAVLALVFLDPIDFSGIPLTLTGPTFIVPKFNIGAMLSVGVPLAILVVGAENAQAIGVLTAEGYKPPVNAMTIYSGIAGMIGSVFCLHNGNIAGPMTVLCSSSDVGPKDKRYGAALWVIIFWAAGGFFALTIVSFMDALPGGVISMVAGLAMLRVISSSTGGALSASRFSMGGLFAFFVGASNIQIFGLTAPFWALVAGMFIVLTLEFEDYKDFLHGSSSEANKSSGEMPAKA